MATAPPGAHWQSGRWGGRSVLQPRGRDCNRRTGGGGTAVRGRPIRRIEPFSLFGPPITSRL